ncbi:FprA family A-type flavoprotein [Clostridiaceae bacterium HFYG-1003]|nr:FprA family A-type flavoprotein [Clostridiaceae bacterium HFYG-1003]
MTREIAKNITLLSMNVEGLLFEGMWHMPHGVTLNSYIVKGERTAIIDGFCGWDGVPETLYKLLDEANVTLDSIRYLIINHMEPDHSGWIEDFKKLHSNFEIYCTKESAALLRAFYGFEGVIHEITDDETLDLGNEVRLRFKKTPNIHWPDTMMTFEEQSGCLFSCDAFGSFGKLEQNLASETDEATLVHLEQEQLRYFGAILNTFSPFVLRGITKIENLPIQMICPGHGLVWDSPELASHVIADYRRYVEYAKGNAEPQVTILYGSMYGNTEKMAHIAKAYLEEKEVPVVMLKVPETDLGTVLMHTLESKGLVVAAPTYEYKMFPPMASTLDEMGRKMITHRKAVYFGSYGWSGGCLKEYNELLEDRRMKYESYGETEFNGAPTEETIAKVKSDLDKLIAAL